MKKVKTKPETKTKLLDAAMTLMLAKGFTATTVDEICSEAELTKGSFFHYFNSKEDLGLAVLDRFTEVMVQEVQNSPFLKTDDPLKAVFGFLDFTIDLNERFMKETGYIRSCLIGNIAQVALKTHPEFRESCDKHFDIWIGLLKYNLDLAKSKYAPDKDIDTVGLATYILAAYEGSLTIAKAKHNVDVIKITVDLIKQNIADIFEIGDLQAFYKGL